MIVIAAMMLIYGLARFGDLKALALPYFVFACINAAVYPFLGDAPEFWVYSYGVSEALILFSLTLYLTGTKHRLLLGLLVLHMFNNAHNRDNFALCNDVIIFAEMFYFVIRGGNLDFTILRNVFIRNLRGGRNSGSVL